ncbi:hypothetical protein OIU83_01430 [Flavobacterium sp. LS1R49]|uniref:Lipoprotein n=1 Tax=Flavobacterium shii TaxID=2987687 RepID=A0A9X2ZD13_9FLAO|nr:hypothetical protein [Flavobacterium shii]MCV9926297.1 hypothetical protein [Flavobacterium shii]
MNRRKFITNIGIGTLGLYFTPTIVSCSNKDSVNLDSILGKPITLLSNSIYLDKEGNKDFGYYHYDKNNFTIEKYKGKESFIFYKDSKIVGYTLQIEGDDFFKQNVESISKSMGNYKTNFKNDFGEELQWSNSGTIIKLSVTNFKDLPKLTFYSEFLENAHLVL